MTGAPTFPQPTLPGSTALRLVCRTPGVTVVPPCGLPRWSDSEDADVAVVLARADHRDLLGLAEVQGQLPAAATLRPGTLVVVLGELAPSGALLGRWLKPRARAARGVRGSALLALGYVRLGGGVDPRSGHDLAWGYAPSA